MTLTQEISDGFGALTNENINSIIGNIPPNSNLNIHLELVSWKSVTDVMGDKKILKTLIKAGEGYDRPNEGSLVKGKLNKRFRDQCPLYVKTHIKQNKRFSPLTFMNVSCIIDGILF